MANLSRKLDQDPQARQPGQTRYPHHGDRIRDQNPREDAPRDAGDEEE